MYSFVIGLVRIMENRSLDGRALRLLIVPADRHYTMHEENTAYNECETVTLAS
jgi:hypothetical protein